MREFFSLFDCRLMLNSGILALALSICACAVRQSSPAVIESIPGRDPRVPLTFNERLALRIPEFGGAFRQKDGSLGVFLTDFRGEPKARQLMQVELLQMGAKETHLHFLRGKYTYIELRRIHANIPNLGRGISSYGVDPSRNRYLITVTSAKEIAPMRDILRRAGLTLEAFVIEIAPRAQVL